MWHKSSVPQICRLIACCNCIWSMSPWYHVKSVVILASTDCYCALWKFPNVIMEDCSVALLANCPLEVPNWPIQLHLYYAFANNRHSRSLPNYTFPRFPGICFSKNSFCEVTWNGAPESNTKDSLHFPKSISVDNFQVKVTFDSAFSSWLLCAFLQCLFFPHLTFLWGIGSIGIPDLNLPFDLPVVWSPKPVPLVDFHALHMLDI
mgnify:CR=1 FL=1